MHWLIRAANVSLSRLTRRLALRLPAARTRKLAVPARPVSESDSPDGLARMVANPSAARDAMYARATAHRSHANSSHHRRQAERAQVAASAYAALIEARASLSPVAHVAAAVETANAATRAYWKAERSANTAACVP